MKKAALAREIGVTPQRLSQIEAQNGELSIAPFVKAVRILRVRAEWLALGEGEMEISSAEVPYVTTEEQELVDLWRYLSPQQAQEWIGKLKAARDANIAVAKHIQDIRWRHAPNEAVAAAFGPVPSKRSRKVRPQK